MEREKKMLKGKMLYTFIFLIYIYREREIHNQCQNLQLGEAGTQKKKKRKNCNLCKFPVSPSVYAQSVCLTAPGDSTAWYLNMSIHTALGLRLLIPVINTFN